MLRGDAEKRKKWEKEGRERWEREREKEGKELVLYSVPKTLSVDEEEEDGVALVVKEHRERVRRRLQQEEEERRRRREEGAGAEVGWAADVAAPAPVTGMLDEPTEETTNMGDDGDDVMMLDDDGDVDMDA